MTHRWPPLYLDAMVTAMEREKKQTKIKGLSCIEDGKGYIGKRERKKNTFIYSRVCGLLDCIVYIRYIWL